MAPGRHTSKAKTRRFRGLMGALRKGQMVRNRRRKAKPHQRPRARGRMSDAVHDPLVVTQNLPHLV